MAERFWRVRWECTNTGRFRLGCSCCGELPARWRTKCYHACSVRESKGFWSSRMLCKFQPVTSHLFFMWNGFFWAICLCKQSLLCYWSTIHNSISNICPKFQVLSFAFLRLMPELLDEHWAKILQSENISNWKCPMRWHVLIKGLLSRILVYRVWPWYSTWAIWARQFCTQKFGSRLQYMTDHILLSLVNWYELMAWWLRQVVVFRVTWVLFSRVLKLLPPLGHLRGTVPVSALTLFNCCTLYNFLSFMDFVSGYLVRQCLNSLHHHPTSTCLKHLESDPWPRLGHMCGPFAWAWL